MRSGHALPLHVSIVVGVTGKGTSRVDSVPMPTGAVTFLFSDIEGSTALLRRLGDAYAQALSDHRSILRNCFSLHHGFEVDTAGDAFFVAFATPEAAIAAATDGQLALSAHRWPGEQLLRVRMGLHLGWPLIVDASYVGLDVHRASRICDAAHGGQVLISEPLRQRVFERLPRGVSIGDLGEHRLKDLPALEHLWQLDVDGLPRSFPPVRSQQPPNNLPRNSSALVGRGQERQLLDDLMRDPAARLITVKGPGGTGKTRLVTEVALDVLDHFTHGVHFIDLSVISKPDQVLPLVARTIGLQRSNDLTQLDALRTEIGDKRILLILDNAEHVSASGPDLAHLVAQCPRLTVVFTSRVRLGLREESDFELAPLALPRGQSLEEVGASDAVRLFVARASKTKSGFGLTPANAPTIMEICCMLDGLPLAIELAATKVRLFTPEALLRRLGNRLQLLNAGSADAPERHRGLRATIDWSYALLGADERRYLLTLAIFHGGARLEAIQAVLETTQDVSEPITTLIDHSLVTTTDDADGDPRITMLQTIRDYATDVLRMDPSTHAALADRHAQYYLSLVESAMPRGIDVDTRTVKREYENVLAALDHWIAAPTDDPLAATKGLRMAGAMGHYWFLHGQSTEGVELLNRALSIRGEVSKDVRARALLALGYLFGHTRDEERATKVLSDAMSLCREVGDGIGEAHCLNGLGLAALNTKKYLEAERYLQAAVKLGEEVRDVGGLKGYRNNLAVLYLAGGDWGRATRLLLENSAPGDRTHDVLEAITSENLGVAHIVGKRPKEAAAYLKDALDEYLALEDPNGVIETIESTVGLAVLSKHWSVAARLAGGAEVARQRSGRFGAPVDQLHLASWTGAVRRTLGTGAFETAAHEGAAMTYGQLCEYARSEIGDVSETLSVSGTDGHTSGASSTETHGQTLPVSS